MLLQVVQPMLFTKREICHVDRSSSLAARFSVFSRDFPNTRGGAIENGAKHVRSFIRLRSAWGGLTGVGFSFPLLLYILRGAILRTHGTLH